MTLVNVLAVGKFSSSVSSLLRHLLLKLVPDWPKAVRFPASHLRGATCPNHLNQLLSLWVTAPLWAPPKCLNSSPRPYGRVQTPYRGSLVTPSPLCFSHYVEMEVHRARHWQLLTHTHWHSKRITANAVPLICHVLELLLWRLQETPPLQKCSNYINDASQLFLCKTSEISSNNILSHLEIVLHYCLQNTFFQCAFEWMMYSLYEVIIVRMFFLFVNSVGKMCCWGKYL